MRQPWDALVDLIGQGIAAGEVPPQDARLSAIFAIGIFMRLAVSSFQDELPAALKPLAPEVKQRLFALLGLGELA